MRDFSRYNEKDVCNDSDVPVATFRMDEVALSGASELCLRVFSNHSDLPFGVHDADHSKIG